MGQVGQVRQVRQVGQVGVEPHRHLWDGWDKWDGWEQKKLPLVRQLNSLLYTNYLIIHHLHQSSLKTL